MVVGASPPNVHVHPQPADTNRRAWHRDGAGEATLSAAVLLQGRSCSLRLEAGTLLKGTWSANQPLGRFAVVGPDGTAMRDLLFRLGGGPLGLSSRLVRALPSESEKEELRARLSSLGSLSSSRAPCSTAVSPWLASRSATT